MLPPTKRPGLRTLILIAFDLVSSSSKLLLFDREFLRELFKLLRGDELLDKLLLLCSFVYLTYVFAIWILPNRTYSLVASI